MEEDGNLTFGHQDYVKIKPAGGGSRDVGPGSEVLAVST